MATIIKQWTETKERSQKYAQNFDKEKITIVKAGKEINVYDMIQAAREDTEIYPTLEKYGTLQTMERDAQLVYADLTEIEDLTDLYQKEKKIQEVFENLPSKERNIFDNDIYKFKQYGMEYYLKKAQEELKQNQVDNTTTPINPETKKDDK